MVTKTAYRLFALTVAAALALAAFMAALPALAFADPEGPDITPVEPTELQLRVENSAVAYKNAVAKVEDLQVLIDKNNARIKKIEAKIPKQREKAEAAVVAMYKLSENGTSITDVLMGVKDFDEFMSAVDYLSTVANVNLSEIAKLEKLQSELSDTQAELLAEMAEAEKASEQALQALDEARAAREEAAAAAAAAVTQQEIDAMRDQVAEAAAAEAYAQAEEQGASEEEAETQAKEAAKEAASNVTAETVANGDVDWGMDRDDFVDEWSKRIDSYLEGSPLEGQGENFAEAAWDYGVDPRWSPAIANTESTKGEYTFADHNAWGWGSEGWNSWDEAIDTHVKGLAEGYGSTISEESAEKYCPPNAEEWYDQTLDQMNQI